MRTATSLTLMAIGAIFAFAIPNSPTFLNLQVVGWILMLTGVVGLLLSRRSQDWLRRTIVRNPSAQPRTRRRQYRALSAAGPAGPVVEVTQAEPVVEYAQADPGGEYAQADPAAYAQPDPAVGPPVTGPPPPLGADETQPIAAETIDEYSEG